MCYKYDIYENDIPEPTKENSTPFTGELTIGDQILIILIIILVLMVIILKIWSIF